MINNYDSVVACGSAGSTSSCKQEETSYTAVKRTWLSFVAVLVTLFSFVTMQGQTTLISPTGDGGFENGATFAANGWTVVNGTLGTSNTWHVGNAAVSSSGANGAYVSANSGTTWGYNTANTSTVHFYKDVTSVSLAETILSLSFKWKGTGESGWDRLLVYVAPTTVVPTSGTPLSNGTTLTGATLVYTQANNSQSTYTAATVSLPSSLVGTTFRVIFTWQNDGSFGSTPAAAIDEISLTTSAPANFNVVQGGLWSSPATWAGGVVPGAGNDVTIPAGMIVTVDQVLNYRNITVNGTLQWNATANAMTVTEDLTIGATGSLLAYTAASTPAGSTLNIGRNFVNDGYANLALATLNFNGSGSTLSGAGDFQGVPFGIIKNLYFQNAGSNAITTTNNLIVSTSLIHTAGSLNTNGKLTVDNTVQIYGQSFNNRLASIAVTNMGSAYPVAPVVFGLAVTQWSNITGVLNTLYVSGNNVYRCTTAANIGPSAPTHTSGTAQNLLWVGTIGTLGTPFLGAQSHTSGTQYFYGNNLYTCIATGSASASAPPVHTSGAVVSGSATFLYAGTVAKVSPNFDATTGTVRSLNIVQRGSGYTSTPAVAFSRGDATTLGSGAAATAVVFISITGNTSSSFTKGGGAATISGGLTINSDQGASVLAPTNEQASSGVGNIFATNGGVNYTVAPQVGFSLPTALNLVTNPGSGYTTAPTITVTGGTLVSGSALATGNFTITVNDGKVVSVYLTSGNALYSTLPTLAFSSGTATLAFPANCLPAATAIIGGNGQISNFTMTNSGYGYVAEPTVGVGTTSATVTGGTFTTVASGFTARIGLYNLTTGFYLPATTAVVQGDDAAIPSNRKLNTLTLATNAKGMNITSNLTIFGSATTPLGFTSSDNGDGNVLNLGGNNLIFTWNGYGGRTSTFGTTFAYIKNGSMTLTGRGGSSTFNYPFSGTFTWYAGDSTPATTGGSSVTRVTVSDTAAPTTTVAGTGIATGTRAFRVQYADIATGVTPVTGLNPKVTLNYNSQDALTGTQDQLFVSESSALNGPWTVRSVTSGTGTLTATGTRTTATATPGPIAPTNNRFYAWSNSAPQITSVAPLTVCANSGTFTITGTNFSGVTAVSIGGTAVTAFTIVSDTSITGYAGNGTTGTVSLVKNGTTFTGTDVVTVTPSPSAPNVTPANATVNLGATVSFTATGGSTFDWYTTATGGTSIFTGATYSAAVCSSTTLYVAANNGSCEGARTAVTINVNATVITPSIASFCGTGGATVLTVTPNDPSITYTWDSVSGSPTLSATTGQSITANLSTTSDIRVIATKGACSSTQYVSIGVYDLPTATVTTTADGVCPGTSATIGSGLSAGNFISLPITPNYIYPPSNATILATAGAAVVPQTSVSLDDGGWGGIPVGFNFNFFGTNYSTITVGTNGTVFFGTTPNVNDFTFTTLPSTSEPFNMIAVLAMDNNLNNSGATSGGTVSYWTEGFAPNRRFVVNYQNVREHAATNTSTAQAVFYETTGVIEVQVLSSTNVSRNKLVGVNNGDGTIGVLAYASGTTASATNPIASPFAYRFTPPANYNTTWTATDANGTTTIASGTNIFSQSVSPAITTTYSISYTNLTTGCTNAPGSAQRLMTVLNNFPPASVSTIATSNSICFGESVGLSLSYTGILDGLVFQWQSSVDNGSTWQDIALATATSLTVTPTVATKYRCRMISCGGTPGYSSVSSVVFTNGITGTSPATRCGTGTATINALSTAGSVVNWYAAATGGTSLGAGVTFTTPSIATTTTFYAAAESSASGLVQFGNGTTTSGGSLSAFNNFWASAKYQMIYTASELATMGLRAGSINSIAYFVTSLGDAATNANYTVKLANTSLSSFANTTFTTPTFTTCYGPSTYTHTASGWQTITFSTPYVWDGVSNIIIEVSHDGADMFGSANTQYTATTDDTVLYSFNGSDFNNTLSKNRFNVLFSGQVACASPRVPVVVTVNPAPALTLSSPSATICNGGTTAAVTIATGASNYNTYAWSPATTVSGNSTTGWTFNPTATTTYTLTASQSGGSLCATTATFTANVNALPSAITITPANAAACVGVVLPMTATGGNFAQNAFTQPMEVLPTNFDVSVNATATFDSTYFAQGAGSVLFTTASTSANETFELNQNIDLTGAVSASVTFSHIAAMESSFDFGYVEYSTDGGSTWTTFTPANYVGTAATTVFNANARFSKNSYTDWNTVFSTSSSTPGVGPATSLWKMETFNIPAAALTSSQFRIRFRYTTDTSINYLGWLIDDVKVIKSQNNITWSPVANLYTNAAATVPYTTGTSASTVYVLPTTVAPLTYVATSTNGSSGCISTASITVRDAVVPVVVTRPVTIQLNAAGNATLTAAQVDNGSSDNCSIATMTVSPNTFTCANVGPNTVTLTVTDASGNSSSRTAVVTVRDQVGPTVVTQPVTVQLSSAGTASITAAQVNNGSTDACGIASISVSPNTFTCANLGANTVTLTVTDVNGNISTGTAVVTVTIDFTTALDNDLDGSPDNCDPDDDNDGVLDTNDNCQFQANANQADNDADGEGDACDDDDDNDGVLDGYDNCQFTANTGQEDIDNDGMGDICDTVEINVSEAITPDGDGVNDTWFINNIQNYPNNSVKVYNRWGDLIFSRNNYQNDWNGSYSNNGSNTPDASSYYYQIDLDGNGSIDYDGWIYITK